MSEEILSEKPMLNFPSMEKKQPIKPLREEEGMLSFDKSELQMEDIRLRNQSQAEKEQKIRDDYLHEQENIMQHGPLDKLNEEVIPEDEQGIADAVSRGNYAAVEQEIHQELTNLGADSRAIEFLSLCREMGGSSDPEVHAILGQLSSLAIRLIKKAKRG